MGRASKADKVLILGSEDEIEGLDEKKACHDLVDPVDVEAILKKGEVDPDGEEDYVSKSENEVDRRDGSLTDGEKIAGAIEANIVHLRTNGHGYQTFGCAVGEVDTVFIRAGDGEGVVVGIQRGF